MDIAVEPASSQLYFRYRAPSSITSIVPDRGVTAGGDLVTVYGSSFESTYNTHSLSQSQSHADSLHVSMSSVLCVFGDISVLGWVVNSTAIQCESPSDVYGRVRFALTLDGDFIPSESYFDFR